MSALLFIAGSAALCYVVYRVTANWSDRIDDPQHKG